MELTKQYSEQTMLNLKGVKSILRDKYVSIVEKGKVIFIMLGQNGVIYYASDYVNEILNYSSEELVGKKLVDLIEASCVPYFNSTIQQLIIDGSEPVDFKDLGLYCVDCQRHYFDGMITYSEIFPEAHYVIYLHDVTDRKIKEEKLTQINLELDGFIYKASHDLRAPLASLAGLINLTEKSISIESKEYIELMKRSVKRLDQYITKLAHYTRNSNLGLEYNEINFKLVLTDIIEAYKFLPNADRIDFRISIDEKQPVRADLFRLQLILNNLISNAIKYYNPHEPNPYVEITVVADAKKFELIVSDNGIGITEEYKGKIFNMFQRATTQAYGSGIGLYLVKKALAKMKGKVEVQSEYGQGTEFTLTIPNHVEDCLKLERNPC
jgi:PAS domain S-box-containing protein